VEPAGRSNVASTAPRSVPRHAIAAACTLAEGAGGTVVTGTVGAGTDGAGTLAPSTDEPLGTAEATGTDRAELAGGPEEETEVATLVPGRSGIELGEAPHPAATRTQARATNVRTGGRYGRPGALSARRC
jgi:hypothetical protein